VKKEKCDKNVAIINFIKEDLRQKHNNKNKAEKKFIKNAFVCEKRAF
jgi:hypothetical protein